MSQVLFDRVTKDIAENKILLFVKGNKAMPQCGFSAQVIEIFQKIGKPFETRDILADPELRSGMKEFSKWPTFPQIYINGQFVGGCDIVSEMYQKGELQRVIDKAFS